MVKCYAWVKEKCFVKNVAEAYGLLPNAQPVFEKRSAFDEIMKAFRDIVKTVTLLLTMTIASSSVFPWSPEGRMEKNLYGLECSARKAYFCRGFSIFGSENIG